VRPARASGWTACCIRTSTKSAGRARYTRQAVIDFIADRGAPPQVIAYHHRIEHLAADVALLHFGSHESPLTERIAMPRCACPYGGERRPDGNCTTQGTPTAP